MITTINLKNIGLSENEAKVYLAMLELGPSPVAEIAKKAEINRPTAYFQIEALKKLGLVSVQSKGKKQLFIAESPEQLESVLNEEAGRLQQKKEELGSILPALLEMHRASDTHPQVKYFEGVQGLLRMQEVLLNSGAKEVLAIGSADDVLKIFPNQQRDYATRRIAKGIRSRFIYTSSRGPILNDSDKMMLRESRYISSEKMPLKGDLAIYGNSVSITALKGKISGVVIEHDEIADSFRNIFEFLWQSAERI